jgi:hypothetical protein
MVKKSFLALAAAAFLFGGAATVAPTTAEATFMKKDRGHHGKVMGWKHRHHADRHHGGWMHGMKHKMKMKKARKKAWMQGMWGGKRHH